jgi:hypothetical protein
MFRKLIDVLFRRPVDQASKPQAGRCDKCDESFAYELCHSGMADMG